MVIEDPNMEVINGTNFLADGGTISVVQDS